MEEGGGRKRAAAAGHPDGLHALRDVFAAACLIISLAAALWARVGRRQRNNFSLN